MGIRSLAGQILEVLEFELPHVVVTLLGAIDEDLEDGRVSAYPVSCVRDRAIYAGSHLRALSVIAPCPMES